MNGRLVGVAYAVCGVLLVGCATGAVDPKKPGDEALTCPRSKPRSTRRMQPHAARPGKPGRSKPAHLPIKRRNGCPLWAACCLS
jgi:hypothetical protein